MIFGWLSVAEESLGPGACAMVGSVHLAVLHRFIPGREMVANALLVAMATSAAYSGVTVLGYSNTTTLAASAALVVFLNRSFMTTYQRQPWEAALRSVLEHYAFLLPLTLYAAEENTKRHPLIKAALKQYIEEGASLATVSQNIKETQGRQHTNSSARGGLTEKQKRNLEKKEAKKAARHAR